MFKLPGVPAVRASAHELADFAELMAWRDGRVSTTDLSRAIGRNEENDYSAGVPEEDEAEHDAESAYVEIEIRDCACGTGTSYPFSIGTYGNTLVRHSEELNCRQLVYLYLLLATRLNMRDNRVHAEIDGTLLFEKVCADIARSYLGDRAKSMVFGTAAGAGGFRDKVGDLCRQLGEGGGVRDGVSQNKRDGKLDVVAWKPFADSWQGKLMIFGQCKTGTNYKDVLMQLQPDQFCAKWLQERPPVVPIRAFFVSEALSRSGAPSRRRWYEDSIDAGLLFDRCRIVDFCDSVAEEVLEEVRIWTEAAAEGTELPAP